MTRKIVEIYAHIRGHMEDDNDARLEVKQEFCRLFKELGAKGMKDADAALLSGERENMANLDHEVSDKLICFIHGKISLEQNVDRAQMKQKMENRRFEMKPWCFSARLVLF